MVAAAMKENAMRGIVMVGLGLCLFALGCGGGAAPGVKSGPMPDGGSWSGVYFSPQYGEMHLVQNGSAVHGRYKKDERTGDIQGEAEGNVLEFEWVEYKAMVSNRPQETRGHGYFQYLVDPGSGDHLIKGRWGIGEDSANGGEWNAYRARNKEPDPDSLREGATSGGEGSDGEGGDELDEPSESESESEDEDEIF
jgi:hypothetical protein